MVQRQCDIGRTIRFNLVIQRSFIRRCGLRGNDGRRNQAQNHHAGQHKRDNSLLKAIDGFEFCVAFVVH